MSTLAQLPAYTILDRPAGVVEGNDQGWRASLTFRCAYSDRLAFLTVASGVLETFTLPGGVTYQRLVPLRHPDFPNLYATGLRAEGFGHKPGVATFTDCRIQVDFSNIPGSGGTDRPFIEKNLDHGGTHTTCPGEGMKFSSDNLPIRHDHGLFVPEQGYLITTYFNSSLNDDVIDSLTGKVNSVAFLGKAIGCARFDGCRSSFSQTLGGQTTYTKTFSMTFRRRPWNQVLRPGMVWDTPVGALNGLPMHESADLNALL